MSRPHRLLVASLLLIFPWLGPGSRPEADLPTRATLPCADPVSLEAASGHERLVCGRAMSAALAAVLEDSDCPVDLRAPAFVAGDRLRVVPAGAGRCRVVRRPLEGAALVALGLPLDLNRASEADLKALPGIGPARARALVAYRDGRGGFESPGELVRVPGLGPGTVTRLEGLVAVRARPGAQRRTTP